MLRAVLFDWGDTLMSYEWNDEVAREGSRRGLAALQRDGLPDAGAIGDWFRAVFGDGREYEDELVFADIIRQCFSEFGCDLDDDDVRLYMQTSHAHWETGYTVPPEAHGLLEALRDRGLKTAIVSNTVQPEWLLRPVLERQGLAPRVDAIVLSSEVGKRKPHPAMFEAAMRELEVEAAECLFVGDRLYNDVRGAKQVGMETVQAIWFRADEHAEGWEADHQAFRMLGVLDVAERALARAAR